MSLGSSLLPPAWPIGSAGIHSQDKTNKSRSSARGTHIPSPTPLINTLVIMASGILRGTAAADKDLPSPGSPCRSGWGTALFLTWGWGEWQDGGHQVTALQLLCGSIPAHSPTCIPPPGAFAHHMSPAEPSDWPTMTSPYFKARLQAGEGGVRDMGHADQDSNSSEGGRNTVDFTGLATCTPRPQTTTTN